MSEMRQKLIDQLVPGDVIAYEEGKVGIFFIVDNSEDGKKYYDILPIIPVSDSFVANERSDEYIMMPANIRDQLGLNTQSMKSRGRPSIGPRYKIQTQFDRVSEGSVANVFDAGQVQLYGTLNGTGYFEKVVGDRIKALSDLGLLQLTKGVRLSQPEFVKPRLPRRTPKKKEIAPVMLPNITVADANKIGLISDELREIVTAGCEPGEEPPRLHALFNIASAALRTGQPVQSIPLPDIVQKGIERSKLPLADYLVTDAGLMCETRGISKLKRFFGREYKRTDRQATLGDAVTALKQGRLDRVLDEYEMGDLRNTPVREMRQQFLGIAGKEGAWSRFINMLPQNSAEWTRRGIQYMYLPESTPGK